MIIAAGVILLAVVLVLFFVFRSDSEPVDKSTDPLPTTSEGSNETEETPVEDTVDDRRTPREASSTSSGEAEGEAAASPAAEDDETDHSATNAAEEATPIELTEALAEQGGVAIGNLTASNDRYEELIEQCDLEGIANEKTAFGIHRITVDEFIAANEDIDAEILVIIEGISELYAAALERNAQLFATEQAECAQD